MLKSIVGSVSSGPRLGHYGNGDGRRAFVAPLHATLRPIGQSRPCRVCAETIEAGAPAWHRAWHVEFAHEACGYVKRGEEAPHECRKPGSFTTYWEWACPECGLDACAPKAPAPGRDLRCGRCRSVTSGDEALLVEDVVVAGERFAAGHRVQIVEVLANETDVIVRGLARMPLVKISRSKVARAAGTKQGVAC